MLTALRDEVRRGNVAVGGSKRFGHLSDLFMPEDEWDAERAAFFERAGLPRTGAEAARLLEERLQTAYDQFCAALPDNAHVTVKDDGGWRFGSDPAEGPDDDEGLAALHAWLDERMRRVQLPDLLIEADNALEFHPPPQREHPRSR